MRIMVVSNLYPPDIRGGYEILCAQICDALNKRGHRLRILTTGKPGADEKDRGIYRSLRLISGFDHKPETSRSRRLNISRYNQRQTAHAIRWFRPDVVAVFSQLRLTLGCTIAAEAEGVPTVHFLNDPHLRGMATGKLQFSPRSMIRWVLEQTSCKELTLEAIRLQHPVVISNCLRRDLVAGGVPVAHAKTIYQAIDPDAFPLKDRPGQLHDPPRLLYAGQLHAYKGVHHLLQAIALVEKDGRRFDVGIAGEGDKAYTQCLKNDSRALGSRVVFHGRIDQGILAQLYRDADIFVFPSVWREPFGLTHLEAMSSGTPVVSTAEGGHGEFLEHEKNALIYESGNIRDLAKQLKRLLDDNELRARLAARASEVARTRFGMERYIDEIEKELSSVAGVQS